MTPQADSLSTLLEFDKSLRLECEAGGIDVRDNGRSLTLLAARGIRLTLTYRPDRILLRFEGSTLQGTSHIAYDSEGLKLHVKDHRCPMDAHGAAKYVVVRLLKGKMP